MDNNYEPDYGMDNYDDKQSYGKDKSYYKSKDSSNVECNNFNVNGLGINALPPALNGLATVEAQAADEGDVGASSFESDGGRSSGSDTDFKVVCIYNNNNKVIGGGEEEPETASLTVNKEVFGCNIIGGEFNTEMICDQLQSDSTDWLPCTDPEISDFTFITICKKLTDNLNLFDIEVLDSQDIQLEKFEASAQGTTVQNLQAGTYGVNEIKDPSTFFPVNVLYVAAQTEEDCLDNGFSDGGDMFINVNVPPEPTVQYKICVEYKDEQGIDCSDVTLVLGENKLCTVKNYILHGSF